MSTAYNKNLDQNSDTMESKKVLDNGYMCPVTPYSRKECVNSANKYTPMDEDKDYLCTPMEDVFTPSNEKLVSGINHVKISEKTGSYVARRLKFGDKSVGAEEYVSENISDDGSDESFLDIIMTKRAEDNLEEISDADGFMTPPSVGRLSETCPGAPMKPVAGTSRTFDASVCRELEF